MSRNENYDGREQSQVKHFILEKYLERFAHIIGSWADTITYVDCFSGPWKAQASDLSDTSFAIALRELRKARDTHAEHGKTLRIRCLFLEEQAKRYGELKRYADRQNDIEVETLNSAMLDSIHEITGFIRQGGKKSFSFTFIDPTGWSGFDLNQIQPLLQETPGEVLINFMTEHIRRFVSPKERREEIIDSFRRLFGSEEAFERVRQIPNAQDREDELFTAYASGVRKAGEFDYTCPAVVFHPIEERTHFHLIYATRHPKGVEVFKDVEKRAFDFQEEVRAEAEERKEVRETKQPSLFAGTDQPPSHRAVALRERYLTAAIERIEQIRGERKQVPFDEIWGTALGFPLVWDSDVKELMDEWQSSGRVKLLNLPTSRHKPKWGQNHIVEFLK